MSSLNIPTLSPTIFRNNHIINNSDYIVNHENISRFFIHSFKDDKVELNLPLPPHKKTVNDLMFITNGCIKGYLGIDSYQLEKNDFLFTPRNTISSAVSVSSDLEGFYCHFSDEIIEANPFLEILYTQRLDGVHISIPESEAKNLEYLLNRVLLLYKSFSKEGKDYHLLSYYISTILAEVFLSFKKTEVIPRKNSDILLKFKSLAYDQYREQISIKEYASQLNITANHLNKVVKSETGKTATEIIREIVILEAKVLLLQSKLTISEISLALGFDDASYFSRFFKKETGYTPTKYLSMIESS
ncbi:helix-turn-helix domain-containing protein [Algoriphagus sp.]|uniref:helix-turn-helix domain-containing protein n=1 Tax=Algoriphagus sp. TaxID=1872435 RepID=UPI003F724789